MKTRFCSVVGLASVWVIAAGWFSAAARAQNDNWHGEVQQASAVDRPAASGSALASDSEEQVGSAFAADPSWIVREPTPATQGDSHSGRIAAIDKPKKVSQGPPPPPPDEEPAEKPAEQPAPEPKSNSANSNSSCDSCNKFDTCGDNCCGNCCDECCHDHCYSVFDRLDCCPLYSCDEEPCRALDCCWARQNDVALYGWIDGGIMGNADSPRSHFNGPVTFPDRDDSQLNQFYGVLERTAACDNCGWFVGGRVDMYWGSDFAFTTAAGLDGQPRGNVPRWESTNSFLYGWSMPQLYAEVDYNDLQFKLGHFYSPIGYEVAPAVGNFFYTHSYARQYGEPFTHTGVLASQPLNENWKWYAGIDNGWNAFDCNSRANFLGGLSYHDDCWGSLSFMIQTGDDTTFDTTTSGIGPFANRTTYSLVWERNFTNRFTYVLEHNLGIQQDADTIQGPNNTAEWYGLTNYLFYKINSCWDAGYRFEVFRDDDGFAVTGLRPGNPLVGNFFAGNFFEMSLGLNWKPNSNIVVRPEIRWDWFNPTDNNRGNQFPFNDDTSRHQFLFGLDAIVRF